MKLTDKICVPCQAGTKPFTEKESAKYLKQLPKGWKVMENKILKEFNFKTYPETMAFVNRAALIAQEEGHHPNLEVGYSKVIVSIWTHAIGGLSENDFILAAKIDL